MLSMAKDGEVIFRVNNYMYKAKVDTANYPYIKKWMYRKPGMILNSIKRNWEVKRI